VTENGCYVSYPHPLEILKDNARPEAAAVYGALDMPWATLVGQISKAYGKQSAAAPMNLR
jgi:hypothetical protein